MKSSGFYMSSTNEFGDTNIPWLNAFMSKTPNESMCFPNDAAVLRARKAPSTSRNSAESYSAWEDAEVY